VRKLILIAALALSVTGCDDTEPLPPECDVVKYTRINLRDTPETIYTMECGGVIRGLCEDRSAAYPTPDGVPDGTQWACEVFGQSTSPGEKVYDSWFRYRP
jgi:hypothetical protein